MCISSLLRFRIMPASSAYMLSLNFVALLLMVVVVDSL
jgi:hypothetical protein